MIGLCGAQGTGKTTLAKAYSEKFKVPFVETDVSGTFARLGADPRRDYPILECIEIQREILKDYRQLLKGQPFKFITDRTPIDMMAYMLADVRRENVTDQQGAALLDYLEECHKVCNEQFTILMVIQPGIPLRQARPDKAPPSPAFMEHMNAICMGLVVSGKIDAQHFYMPRGYLDLDTRVQALDFAVGKAKTRHEQKMLEQAASIH